MDWKKVFMIALKVSFTILTTLYIGNRLGIEFTMPFSKPYIINLLANFGLLSVYGKAYSWILDKLFKRIGWIK